MRIEKFNERGCSHTCVCVCVWLDVRKECRSLLKWRWKSAVAEVKLRYATYVALVTTAIRGRRTAQRAHGFPSFDGTILATRSDASFVCEFFFGWVWKWVNVKKMENQELKDPWINRTINQSSSTIQIHEVHNEFGRRLKNELLNTFWMYFQR